MFEVLEGGWDGLVQSVNNSKSLDGVISAHDSYLNEILVKTLLNNVDAGGNSDDNGKGKSLEDLLRRLLSIALKFGKFQDFIFGNALAALNKAAMTRRLVAETSKSGTWGRKTVDEEEGQVFVYLADASLFQFVEKTAREFDKVLGVLLKMLKKEVFDDGGEDKDDSQPSLNHDALRFLLFRLDYSGYYHRQAKARSKKGSSTSASRESG
jgi:gamma-tubulin complex component 3